MSGPHYEPGTYVCRVVDHGFATAKSGNPMIVFKVEPEARIEPRLGDGGEVEEHLAPTDARYPRTIRLAVNPENEKSMEITLKKLRHAGFEGASFADLDLIGKAVRCVCSHETYQGNQVEQWNLELPSGGGAEVASDPQVARRLNNLFDRTFKAERMAGAGAKPRASASDSKSAAAVTVGDDDIPF